MDSFKIKTCKICGKDKRRAEFVRISSKKRLGYCKSCKQAQITGQQPILDIRIQSLKEGSDIKVRLHYHSIRWSYKITYNRAMQFVEEGLAFIVNSSTIFKPFGHKTIRRMIFERDKNRCFYCGEYGDTLDHIVPISSGGITSFKNCVVCCLTCNRVKRSLPLEEFLTIFSKNLGESRFYLSKGFHIERKFKTMNVMLEKMHMQVMEYLRDGRTENYGLVIDQIEELEKRIGKIKSSIYGDMGEEKDRCSNIYKADYARIYEIATLGYGESVYSGVYTEEAFMAREQELGELEMWRNG
jgi:hypothetical protein